MKAFQSFRLDASNHCLWRADERVSLPPKAFDVLRYLVEHSGRLVTQDEIQPLPSPAQPLRQNWRRRRYRHTG